MRNATIALLTDFGLNDSYVGVMKGVIAQITLDANIIDICHNIPPGDIRQAAFRLWQVAPYFPDGTIFCAVVDPGVGTSRRSIALRWKNRTCVAPDNGLFTYLLSHPEPFTAVELRNRQYQLQAVSSTFHGRDIFAPAAAYLAQGVPLEEFGPLLNDLTRFPLPCLNQPGNSAIAGEIIHIDRFGNVITSIGHLHYDDDHLMLKPWLPDCEPARLALDGLSVYLPNGKFLQLAITFGDVAEGEPLAYIGSERLLEIAVNRGSAAELLHLTIGQEILLGYQG